MNTLKIADLSEDRINYIFKIADTAKKYSKTYFHKMHTLAEGRCLATLFFEPSTRTRLSFETAMTSLGGNVVTVADGVSSSAMKGETLSDTLMTVGQYADVIVCRTKEHLKEDNLKNVPVPIINGGDGDGEHPTQALLDLYTIQSYHYMRMQAGKLKVLFLGDLQYGRTVHSLMPLLARYDCKIYHRCPDNRKLPAGLRNLSEDAEASWEKRILPHVDVIYCTREQQERAEGEFVENYAMNYGLHDKNINDLNENCIIMHPLPRGGEIPNSFDQDQRSVYFEQARNGVYVRMALLAESMELPCYKIQ